MINRAAVRLRLREPALRWINDADPDPAGHSISMDGANADAALYLIAEEDAESAEDLRRWVEANYLALFESELEGWYTDPELWPRDRTLEVFDAWFEVECHTVLIDTVGGAIVDDEA